MIGEALIVAVAALAALALWLRFVERRDARRFEQRASFLQLRSAAVDAKSLEVIQQRLARLELAKGFK